MSFDVKLYAKNINRMMLRRIQLSENLKHKIESNCDDDQIKQGLALLDKEKIRSQRINSEITLSNYNSDESFVLEPNYCFIIFSYLQESNPILNQVIKKLNIEFKNHKNKKYTISQLNSILEPFNLNAIEKFIIIKQFCLNNNSFEQDDNTNNQFLDVAMDKIKQLANEEYSEIFSNVNDNVAASIKSRIGLSESFIQSNVKNYQIAYSQPIRKIIELSPDKNSINYEKLLSESIINFGYIIESIHHVLKNDLSFEVKEKILVYASAIHNAQKMMTFLDSCRDELSLIKLDESSKIILEALDRFSLERLFQGTPNLSSYYTASSWAAKSINIITSQPENFFIRKDDKDHCISKFKSLISGTTNNRVCIAYL